MLDVLWLIVELSVAFVGGLMACGIIVAFGGLGALRDLRKGQDSLEDEVSRINNRLSRDQKSRAGEKAVEARAEAKSLQQQALEGLTPSPSSKIIRMPGRSLPKVS